MLPCGAPSAGPATGGARQRSSGHVLMTESRDRVGLCRRCIHARIVRTPRSTFWRCALAETDARFERYPRLPVLGCDGFTPASGPIEPAADVAPDHEDGPGEDPPGP